MFKGVGGVSGRAAPGWIVLLALACFGTETALGLPSSTPKPMLTTLTMPDGGPGGLVARKPEATKAPNGTNQVAMDARNQQQDDDLGLHGDLNVLLTELRQIAEKIETIRKEHGQLAHGVSEISSAVKGMNERSEHIKKKVRKMSKTINKTTHHHKFKSSLKNLQKDHKRILEAMLNSTLLLRTHRTNHTATHHTHGGLNKHAPKHLKPCNTSTGEPCPPSPHEKKHNAIPTLPSSTTRSPQTVSPAPFVSTKEDEPASATPTEKDNSIPEPVVEPHGNAEPQKKATPLPVDCTEVIQMGNMTSGVYRIKPKGLAEPLKVWCDHTTQGGGWTMLVARLPSASQQDFNLSWDKYKKGFGDPASEHWIGTEALHAMTKNRRQELRLNITDWKDQPAWAEWKEFSVMSEDKGYALTAGRYASGSTAGDALKWHNGMKFSTPDRDNDALMGGHCARMNNGGWWYRGYRGCYQAHPTGRYQHDPNIVPKKADKRNFDLGPVLAWQNWRGESFFPKTLFLMFRPVMP